MIEEKDIAILDEFIEIIISARGNTVSNSTFQQLPYFENLNSDADNETERLVRIIDKYRVAKVHNLGSNKNPVLQTNFNTIEFKENGGFKKLFQEELTRIENEKEIEVLTTQKLKWDSKLSKWQVRIFWPVFMFGIFSFIFGLYNLITQIEDSRKTKELQIELKNTQEEVSRLRTLVLDQKTANPLHSSKTQIDSLMPR